MFPAIPTPNNYKNRPKNKKSDAIQPCITKIKLNIPFPVRPKRKENATIKKKKKKKITSYITTKIHEPDMRLTKS